MSGRNLMANNIIRFPKTREQAVRIERLVRRDRIIEINVTLLEDEDSFQLQRAWRALFGLCLSIGVQTGPPKCYLGVIEQRLPAAWY